MYWRLGRRMARISCEATPQNTPFNGHFGKGHQAIYPESSPSCTASIRLSKTTRLSVQAPERRPTRQPTGKHSLGHSKGKHGRPNQAWRSEASHDVTRLGQITQGDRNEEVPNCRRAADLVRALDVERGLLRSPHAPAADCRTRVLAHEPVLRVWA